MVWIFCPEMTLAQIPEIGFFVQSSRIGVKVNIFLSAVYILIFLEKLVRDIGLILFAM